MSTQPTRLRALTPEERALSLEGLRAEGLRWLQVLSGRTWTDHNLHDPGITLLEQFCFGLTDVVYRHGFPVADHLTGPDGRIDYEGLSLHPPAAVFPSRATTAADYRSVLLDAVPGLDDAWVEPEADGVYRLHLKLSGPVDAGAPEQVGSTGQATAAHTPGAPPSSQPGVPSMDPRELAARAAYYAQRNLCEDLITEVKQVHDVPSDLHAEIEVEGARDAVDILAEVYDRCARHMAGAPVAHSLDELLLRGDSLETIYDGPATLNGFIDEWNSEREDGQRLFLSELASLIRSVPGVFDVRVIDVVPDPEALARATGGTQAHAPETGFSGSVAWRGDGWALSLRLPMNGTAPTILVRRRGHPLHLSPEALQRRLADLRTAGRAQRARQRADQDERAASLLPSGTHRDLSRYVSVQRHLPAIYGVGPHGIPRSAPPQAHARSRQLKAYMVLHEQVIAQSLAQLQHLRQLFSIDGGSRQTLWSQVIGPSQVPGLEDLHLASPKEIQATVYEPRDGGGHRKRRALDHLLALHGETYTQNTLRQFLSYLTPEELDALLLENKAAWLRQIIAITRDRSAGFDPGRPSWGYLDNCSALHRRGSLLLGFRLWHDRSLTRAIRDHRLRLVPDAPGHQGPDAVAPELARQARPAGLVPRPARREEIQQDLRRMPWLRQHELPASLMRAAVRWDRYRLLPLHRSPAPSDGTVHTHSRGAGVNGRVDPNAFLDAPAGAAGPASPASSAGSVSSPACRLVLGPDERGRHWALGDFADEDAARRAAASLRLFLLHLEQESEGLHVVEHVLLRPLGATSAAHAGLPTPPDFHPMRLTVLLPRWTARSSQAAFQRFAEETLRISTPAHLSLRCLWLDLDAMHRFETVYEAWLDARLHLAAAPLDPARIARVDAASARVIAQLLPVTEKDGDPPVLHGHA